MVDSPPASLMEYFARLKDPRSDLGKRHLLLDIVVIAICAVISGADDWADVELFGRSKETWLRTLLQLPHGIPSEDTVRRVFRFLDPKALEGCFWDWVEGIVVRTRGQVVPIDVKTLRRSHDHFPGYEAFQMVSAWASANGVVLGQLKLAEGSNEIPPIP